MSRSHGLIVCLNRGRKNLSITLVPQNGHLKMLEPQKYLYFNPSSSLKTASLMPLESKCNGN